MTVLGADPQELDALAQKFVNAAQTLQNIRGGLTNSLMSSQWVGGDADRFRSDWSSQYSPSIVKASTALQACSAYLKAQATKQVDASAATDSALRPLNGLGSAIADVETLIKDMVATVNKDQSLIRAEQGKTPAQQLAWWNSLTPAQQKTMEDFAPASLLTLHGLPDSARQAASEQLAQGMASQIPSQVTTASASVSGGEVIVAGANLQYQETKMADGSVTVSLSAEAQGGVGLTWDGGGPSAQISAQLGLGDQATYTFANAAQAHAFEQGLLTAGLPQATLTDASAFLFGGGPAAVAATNIASYLNGYGSHLTSNVVNGQLTEGASVSTGSDGFTNGASATINAGAQVSHDTVAGTTTATLQASGSGYAQLAPFAGSASGNVQAAVTWNSHGQMSGLSLTGQYTATGDDTNFLGMASQVTVPPTLHGSAGSFSMNVDLTNPQNAHAAATLVNDLQNGNASGAAAAYQQLYNGSTVMIQHGTASGSQVDVPLGVAGANVTTNTVDYTSTYVKPPDGDLVPYQGQ